MNHHSLQRIITFILILVSVFASLRGEAVQAKSAESIQTVDLAVSVKDIARVEFGMHTSSFESQHTEFKLEVKNGQLTDGKIKAPVSILSPLLSSLHGMYPGTRSLIWQRWTDDYPHAWVYLFLKDGRIVSIASDSQYDGMFPWNITTWSSEKATQPDAVYVQLHSMTLEGIDLFWKGIGEKGFPRKHYDPEFWKSMQSDPDKPEPEITKFDTSDMDGAETTSVQGAKAEALAPFLPLLMKNADLRGLLEGGYTLYDAALALVVKTKNLAPTEYTGMIALATPDGQDAVVGLVTIPLEGQEPVTTTLKAADALQQVEQRRSSPFLNQAAQILAPLTFLHDTRQGIRLPELNCAEDSSVALSGQALQAIWNKTDPQYVSFFPLGNQRWAVDFRVNRGDPGWSDDMVQKLLDAWFPPAIASLPVKDLKGIGAGSSLDHGWQIAFLPGVTQRDPELLNRLKAQLPQQVVVHAQDPEKDGDYSFLSLNGRVVVSELGAAPIVINCGKNIPNWYGKPYPIESVTPPNDQSPRKNMTGASGKKGDWNHLYGSLPYGERSAQWTAVAFSQPGFLHVLWTVENKGVYYADGWIDGTGWTEPQRLGEDAYWLAIRAWPDGEVHLFWDAGLNTGGTIHVWRPAGGTWQKAEHLSDIGYFSEILRDPSGTLHLGYVGSDGLDSEFMHRTWSSAKGLSAPENISRYLGDIGNTNTVLRFDSQGQLHAAWSHILEQKSAPDPLTGETSDISGVFYARRQPDGRWSKPEQVGTLAPYAHALSMELDAQDQPLIVWQTDDGLVSRIKKDGAWQPAVDLARVDPPKTPEEFGPDRWVKPSADIQTGVDRQDQVIVSWLIPQAALKLATWAGSRWSDVVDILPTDEVNTLESEPETLQMAVDSEDQIHFVFFKSTSLYYAMYDHKTVTTRPLSMSYTGYGLPEASLAVDSVGSIAVLGLPRSPEILVKLPAEGIPATPTPTLVLSATSRPSPTSQPSPMVENQPTATPTSVAKSSPIGSKPYQAAGLVALLVIAYFIVRNMKKAG